MRGAARRWPMRLAVLAALPLALTVGAAARPSSDEDYPFQRAVLEVMGDPVPGLFRHTHSAIVGGHDFGTQTEELCLSALQQQIFTDGAENAAAMPLYGGCYGSLYTDTADEALLIEHCDPIPAHGADPAMAGFHSTFHIARTRAPVERWVMDSDQPNTHFHSEFVRIGECRPAPGMPRTLR